MKIYGKIGAVLTAAAMVVSMGIAQVGAVVSSKPHSDLYSFRMTENGTLALTNCSGKAAIPERYPDDMDKVCLIATSANLNTQAIAFSVMSRNSSTTASTSSPLRFRQA